MIPLSQPLQRPPEQSWGPNPLRRSRPRTSRTTGSIPAPNAPGRPGSARSSACAPVAGSASRGATVRRAGSSVNGDRDQADPFDDGLNLRAGPASTQDGPRPQPHARRYRHARLRSGGGRSGVEPRTSRSFSPSAVRSSLRVAPAHGAHEQLLLFPPYRRASARPPPATTSTDRPRPRSQALPS